MATLWRFGANVDTDQMVPGRFAPYMQPDRPLAAAAFIEARPDFNREAVAGDLILAGNNFGCGSSREYAPQALVERGIAAIIAPSFARIFYRNAINLGLPLFVDAGLEDRVPDKTQVHFDPDTFQLHWRLDHRDHCHCLPPLPSFAGQIVAAGGIVNFVRTYGRFPESREVTV